MPVVYLQLRDDLMPLIEGRRSTVGVKVAPILRDEAGRRRRLQPVAGPEKSRCVVGGLRERVLRAGRQAVPKPSSQLDLARVPNG